MSKGSAQAVRVRFCRFISPLPRRLMLRRRFLPRSFLPRSQCACVSSHLLFGDERVRFYIHLPLATHTQAYCTRNKRGEIGCLSPVFRARRVSTQQSVRVRATPGGGVARHGRRCATRLRTLGAYSGRGCAHKPSCRLTPNLGLSPAAVGLVSTWLGMGSGVRSEGWA